MRIVFTGGGTGGHLYPIIAVAREVRRIAEEERILNLQLFYFGPEAIPGELARAEEIVASRVRAGKIRRYYSLENMADILKTAFGIVEALWNMFLVIPDAVFAKGGYGSFPTLLAARLFRIPVMIHESDAVPGRVNRWAGTWAKRVAISFMSAAFYFPAERTALTGVPVRSRILGGERESSRETLGAFSGRPVILVIGGSQGAAVINHALTEILKDLLDRYEIIHAAGPKHEEDMRLETAPLLENAEKASYHLYGFLNEEELRSALALADLVISRAGATAIFEIAAAGKPAILIPIKMSAQDHQRENAYAYAGRNAALVIEEDNLTPSLLLHEIERLMADPDRLRRMTDAALPFARTDAATLIARELLTLGLH